VSPASAAHETVNTVHSTLPDATSRTRVTRIVGDYARLAAGGGPRILRGFK
jgi:hypothetical protein